MEKNLESKIPKQEQRVEDFGEALINKIAEWVRFSPTPITERNTRAYSDIFRKMITLKALNRETYERFSGMVEKLRPQAESFQVPAGFEKEVADKMREFGRAIFQLGKFADLCKLQEYVANPPERLLSLVEKSFSMDKDINPIDVAALFSLDLSPSDYKVLERIIGLNIKESIIGKELYIFMGMQKERGGRDISSQRVYEVMLGDSDFKKVGRRVEKLKNFYGKKLKLSLADIEFLPDDSDKEFQEKFLSEELRKKVESISGHYEFIGESGHSFKALRNLNLNPALAEALSNKSIFFSGDVKTAHLSSEQVFETQETVEPLLLPTLWGRERVTPFSNVTNYITFGRSQASPPYKGWEYVAAGRGLPEELLKLWINERYLDGEVGGGPGFRKAQIRFDYVLEQMSFFPELKKRFVNVFESLEKWREEAEDIKRKYGITFVTAGAYVRYSQVDTEKVFAGKLNISSEGYPAIHSLLDQGFKAPSQIGARISGAVEKMYNIITEKKEDLTRDGGIVNYLTTRAKELSEMEKKSLRQKYKTAFEMWEALELMEFALISPRGLYLDMPPLHGGAGGEEPPEWDVRTYPFRDRVFLKKEGGDGKKDVYINTKEYHIELKGDDIKIRLYSFTSEPEHRELGEDGLALEIERNGKTKFLTKEELEHFQEELKKYTLVTLYLKGDPLLEV